MLKWLGVQGNLKAVARQCGTRQRVNQCQSIFRQLVNIVFVDKVQKMALLKETVILNQSRKNIISDAKFLWLIQMIFIVPIIELF